MRKTAAFLALAALVVGGGAAWAETFTAKATGVAAGDLITVKQGDTERHLRLFGVACPEPGQPFSAEAKAFTEKRALDKEVSVEIRATDNEGKAVAMVILPDYVNLNHALVQAGLAWWDQDNVPKDAALKSLNAKAITAQAGLWSEPAPLSPTDYRRSKGLEPITYAPTGEEVAAAPTPTEAPEEEPKSISAKCDAVYTGGGRVINVGDIKFDKELTEADGLALLSQHMPTVATDANGNPIGLAVPNISQIPYASALGFQDGDIIAGVNGEPLTNMNQIMGMVERHKNSKTLNVRIIRGGRPETVTFNIP